MADDRSSDQSDPIASRTVPRHEAHAGMRSGSWWRHGDRSGIACGRFLGAARSPFRLDIPWTGVQNSGPCEELSGLRWLRGYASGWILPINPGSVRAVCQMATIRTVRKATEALSQQRKKNRANACQPERRAARRRSSSGSFTPVSPATASSVGNQSRPEMMSFETVLCPGQRTKAGTRKAPAPACAAGANSSPAFTRSTIGAPQPTVANIPGDYLEHQARCVVAFASKRSVGCLDAAIYSLSEHHTLIPSLRIV
jgi:hypothetical protein